MEELKSALGKVYLTIETDLENRWIFTDWQGYLTADNIKTGAKAYTAALAASGFCRVLNDTRSVRGPWDHSMDWVINEWAPAAAQAGLRYFALISTPETLADGSAANFYGQLTAFQGQVFDNMADARAWLRQYCPPS
ncbi:STAS/SEC14 domain-containing protein [Hymenobacter sp. YC55]|uniref:STAS/SEC14 domain-containing protein n=1 Tax=Hymenobacter sp. YC55 TaxID=3034019 RepID=UPI0023FA2016|nr:STAS/SEC14 domain-containing protein [Hymenobacter sp. YC55]MDF7815419.1 STAS/SEC14 domain-containing protein [Hymenobacter sp. YC55]